MHWNKRYRRDDVVDLRVDGSQSVDGRYVCPYEPPLIGVWFGIGDNQNAALLQDPVKLGNHPARVFKSIERV